MTAKVQFFQIFQTEPLQIISSDISSKYWRVGDLVSCVGTPGRSKRGELSLSATQVKMVAPCLHLLTGNKSQHLFFKMLSDPSHLTAFYRKHEILKKIRLILRNNGLKEMWSGLMQGSRLRCESDMRTMYLDKIYSDTYQIGKFRDHVSCQERSLLVFNAIHVSEIISEITRLIWEKTLCIDALSTYLPECDQDTLSNLIVNYDLEFPVPRTYSLMLKTVIPSCLPTKYSGIVSFHDENDVLMTLIDGKIISSQISLPHSQIGILDIESLYSLTIDKYVDPFEMEETPNLDLESKIISLCDKILFK